MMLAYRSAHAKQFYGCFRHVTCGNEDCSKIEYKQRRMDIAQDMLTTFNDDADLPKKVIIDDESRLYGYDIVTKTETFQWKLSEEPRPERTHQVRPNVKILLTVAIDCKGVVYREFLPQGRTVMRRLHEAIR